MKAEILVFPKTSTEPLFPWQQGEAEARLSVEHIADFAVAAATRVLLRDPLGSSYRQEHPEELPLERLKKACRMMGEAERILRCRIDAEAAKLKARR